MKLNLFVPTDNGGNYTSNFLYSSLTGEQSDLPQDPADAIIDMIDVQKSPQKVLARNFLQFLGNRRLTLEKLKTLSKQEQQNIREEFLKG